MVAVSYFTAVLARSDADWRAVAVDVEDAESLDELAEALRAVSRGGPVLAVLEREDAWFAMVRVDGDEDARSFVSDLVATESSQYADLLAPVGDVDMAEHAHLRVARQEVYDDVEDDDLDFSADDDDIVALDESGDAAAAGPTSGNGVEGEPAQIAPAHERQPVAVAVAIADPPPWAGDPGLLTDVGVTAEELVALVDEGEGDPASVIAAVGERCGFGDLLDALR